MKTIDWKSLRTPCFVLSEEAVVDSVLAIRAALDRNWPNHVLSFSVKTNSWPVLQRILARESVWPEVVSDFEYDLAVACGYQAGKFICNGASKSLSYIQKAVANGAVLHLDSIDEIMMLIQLAGTDVCSFGVRINATEENMDADPLSGPKGSRFGLSMRDGDLDRLDELLKAHPNLRLTSIHLHCNTRTRGLRGYRWLIRFFSRIVREHAYARVTTLDIGGSFGHDFDRPGDGEGRWPSWNEYFSCISQELRAEGFSPAALRLVIEPGSGLISGCADYYTRVVGVRCFNEERVLQIDGSRVHVDPHLARASFSGAVQIVGCPAATDIADFTVAYLSGSTCLEKDRLQLDEALGDVYMGDVLRIGKAGGYSFGMSPLFFIHGAPEVYLLQPGSGLVSVQRALGVADYLHLWPLGGVL